MIEKWNVMTDEGLRRLDRLIGFLRLATKEMEALCSVQTDYDLAANHFRSRTGKNLHLHRKYIDALVAVANREHEVARRQRNASEANYFLGIRKVSIRRGSAFDEVYIITDSADPLPLLHPGPTDRDATLSFKFLAHRGEGYRYVTEVLRINPVLVEVPEENGRI